MQRAIERYLRGRHAVVEYDLGGVIAYYPDGQIQAAQISLLTSGNATFGTDVSDSSITDYSIERAIASAASAGATTVTLSSAAGLQPWDQILFPATGEWQTIASISGAVVTLADPAGLEYAYTTSHYAVLPRLSYTITPAVAQAQGVAEAYRAIWRMVLGVNSSTATGGSTTTVEMDDANVPAAIVPGDQLVIYLGTTYGYEQRTIKSTSSAGGTTTITLETALSEAAASSDPVYLAAELRDVETTFDIAYRALRPTLTYARFTSYQQDVNVDQFAEGAGSQFAEQIALAWDLLLDDIRSLGRKPHLFRGEPSIFEPPHATKVLLQGAYAGQVPRFVSADRVLDWIEKIEILYQQRLAAAIKTSQWYDEDNDNVRDTLERQKPVGITMWR